MKNDRHTKILEIIKKYPVTTQDELLDYLRKDGYAVTQSTVSRDIKQLKLQKSLSADGNYCYVATMPNKGLNKNHFQSLFSNSVISVTNAQNIVVIKTDSGMAQAICASIDNLSHDDVVGTIAGEDTILAICKDDITAKSCVLELSKIITR